MTAVTTSPPILSLPDAERMAERTLAAIDDEFGSRRYDRNADADRERVASDLAGLRKHQRELFRGHLDNGCAVCGHRGDDPDACDDARRYSDNLRRTAALYGVTDV